MTVLACPSREQLSGYVLALLPEDSCDEVAQHVERCPACEDVVRDLEARPDKMVALLQQPAAVDEYAEESGCRKALALVEELGRDLPPSEGRTPPPETIRVYRLLEKLGEGGMGTVYKALHTELDKVVAVKVISAQRLADARAVGRFKREMKAVGKLEHPHIVRAFDAGEENGRHYLVMEHVSGCDVGKLADRLGPLPVADACEIVRQAALGLQHAHEHGLVHRDVKPSNLIVSGTRTPVVKVLDLGLALLQERRGEADSELSGEGQVMGTLDYMAPEQGDNSHEVDIRADVYSLGATLYKLLCGAAPFATERYATPLQKVTALAHHEAPPVRQRRPEVPAALAALLERLLAKKPADRPGTPQEAAAALEPFSRGCDLAALLARTAATPDAAPAKVGSTVDQSAAGSAESAPRLDAAKVAARPVKEAKPPRQRRGLLVAAGLLFLAGGVIVAQIIIRVRDKDGKVVGEMPVPPGGKYEVIDRGQPPKPDKQEPSRSVPVKPVPLEIKPEPLPPLKGGEPLGPLALVQRPALIPGVRGWTPETIKPRGPVYCVTYSPDGKRLATAGLDGSIRLYDAATYRLVNVLVSRTNLEPNLHPHQALAWTPDGKALIDGLSGTDVLLWDVESGRRIRRYIPEKAFGALACSPDARKLALLGPSLQVLDLSTGKAGPRTGLGGPPTCLAWSPDGKSIAVENQLYDATSLELRRTFQDPKGKGRVYIHAVSWTPDSKSLFAIGHSLESERRTICWDPETGQIRWVSKPGGLCGACSPDGKTVAVVFGGLHLLNSASGELIRPVIGEYSGAVSWSADSGRLVLGCTPEYGGHGSLPVVDAVTGDLVKSIEGELGDISGVRWSPKGNALAATGARGDWRTSVWDCRTPLLRYCEAKACSSVAWSPGGERLATGAFILNGGSGKLLRQLEPQARFNESAWSPDGTMVAAIPCPDDQAGVVQLYDPATGKLLAPA
jgi:serine/threonine protein kinase/WD40 repeat protein